MANRATLDAVHWIPSSVALAIALALGAMLWRQFVRRLDKIEHQLEQLTSASAQQAAFITRQEFVESSSRTTTAIYDRLNIVREDVAELYGKTGVTKRRKRET